MNEKQGALQSCKASLKSVILGGFFLLAIAAVAGAETYSILKEFETGAFGSLTGPTDVAIAPDGTFYIADSSNTRILRFDPFGNFLSQWTPTNFFPQGIAANSGGDLYYVTNFFDKVLRFSPTGALLSEWGSSGDGNGQFDAPSGIAVGPDGSVYVADTDNHRIQKFDANGTFITAWGSGGNEEGDLRFPKDVATDRSGNVFVVDTDNNRVQLFDPKGLFIAAGGSEGSGPLEFSAPEGIAIGPDGTIYVADTGNDRIQKLSPDGTFAEWGADTLSNPTGLTVDWGSNVYVADSFNDRVVVFKPDIFVFENGATSKSVAIPGPITLSFDIQSNTYWREAATEVFAWVETRLQGRDLKFSLDITGGVRQVSAYTEIAPLLNSFTVPAVLNDIVWPIFSSTAGFPAIDLTFYLCLDRNLNGVYNPAYATCDSIVVEVQ
ncbi:MAG: hypothetical protein A3G93_07780 [Nitrospinae bacterium RIFCSPLOWO2_12_FULL_45_22]|nr:MAG: hypothetical protein A3G93_07780 [Nitrospinae bacterium RIFCSPLOWO2_12_FULL_45_22]